MHRVARREPGVWHFPDWLYAHDDGTFGSRYDDPDSEYRVLYVCSQRRGTFIEVLAYHAPDPALADALGEIAENDDTDADCATAPAGSLDIDAWCAQRAIGTANIPEDRPFVSVADDDTIAALAHRFAALARTTAEEIRVTRDRQLTQPISRFVWEQSTDTAKPSFAGIHYGSRHDATIDNWALFELEAAQGEHEWQVVINAQEVLIEPNDPDVIAALDYHGIAVRSA